MKRTIFCLIESIGIVTTILAVSLIDSEGLMYRIAMSSVIFGDLLTAIGSGLNYLLDEREKNELKCELIRKGLRNEKEERIHGK